MTYHDDIITITLCRGELAASLGEHGFMVKSWPKFAQALKDELTRETQNRGDGHTGSSAVGDLLIDRVIGRFDHKECGITVKPRKAGAMNECWPYGQEWFE